MIWEMLGLGVTLVVLCIAGLLNGSSDGDGE